MIALSLICSLLSSVSIMILLIDCFSLFFFFKQKTAYEMRISDWSSDVCSSDLMGGFCRMAPRQNQAWARLFPSKPSQFLRLSNYDTANNPTCIPFAVFRPKRRPILLNDFPAGYIRVLEV